jgi:gliding motility-associated-like protein
VCINDSVQFNNLTLNGQNYLWDFGDGTNTATETPDHTYGAPGTYTVELTVSYRDESCPAYITKDITVTSAPVVQIANPDGKTSICDGNELVLEVPAGFESYLWSTGETTATIQVFTAGTYSVDVVQGCTISDAIIITADPAPVVTATATPNSTEQGGTVSLSATGLDNYHWTPRENLADSLAAVTDAFPEVTTTYTVTGTDANGCIGSATVEVFVTPENPYNVLHPDVFFSPNQDGVNDVWEVENILSFSACRVTIFDEHGVVLQDAKPYQNDWDGRSSNGKKMPAGVYFYIIRCDGFNGMKSGTLNLIR